MIDSAEFAKCARALKAAAAQFEAVRDGRPEDRLIAHVELSEARNAFVNVIGDAFAEA